MKKLGKNSCVSNETVEAYYNCLSLCDCSPVGCNCYGGGTAASNYIYADKTYSRMNSSGGVWRYLENN